MKKTIVLFLATALLFVLSFCLSSCDKPNEKKENNKETEGPFYYSHVCIIGIDGGGNFFNETNTPNICKLFSKGATAYNASAEYPSSSTQNWMSILHGVAADVHNINGNPIDSSYPYPSVFNVVRQADKDANLCCIVNWDPIYTEMVEQDIGVIEDRAEDDLVVTRKVIAALNSYFPEIMFIQFDHLDGVGHGHGYGPNNPSYVKYQKVLDDYVDRILTAYDDAGIFDDTLFILTTDHGGTFYYENEGTQSTGSHGGDSPEEMTVFLGVYGKTVANITMENMKNRDVAAIAIAALGLEIPEIWTSRVPEGLFTDR